LHFEPPKILFLHPPNRRKEHERIEIEKMHDAGRESRSDCLVID
jgi:hypothetical protein